MKSEQKALIVATEAQKSRGLDELNLLLGRGWRVVQMCPMGGAALGARDVEPLMCLAALVILERSVDAAAAVLEQIQEPAEELLDDHSDGDGSRTDIPPRLTE